MGALGVRKGTSAEDDKSVGRSLLLQEGARREAGAVDDADGCWWWKAWDGKEKMGGKAAAVDWEGAKCRGAIDHS